jgi:hypothetical protein
MFMQAGDDDSLRVMMTGLRRVVMMTDDRGLD